MHFFFFWFLMFVENLVATPWNSYYGFYKLNDKRKRENENKNIRRKNEKLNVFFHIFVFTVKRVNVKKNTNGKST